MVRILLVEDERIVALALKHELANSGFEIVAMATNGRDAIQAVETHTPDIILMDVMIEGDMDGIETARAIAATHTVPILYLTGESDPATQQRAMHSESCMGYMLKPVNTTLLRQKLSELALKGAGEEPVPM